MDRVLTIPNFISLVRLCCIPWFLWLVFAYEQEYQAAWLLGVLGATDWVDGYLARHLGQVSTIGKVLDPTVDRLLLGTAAISLMIVGAMPWWFGVLALLRELLIGLGGIYLGLHGHRRLDVTYIGKVGAFSLMFSFPFFLVWHSDVFWSNEALVLAWVFGVVGVCCSWWSAVGYLQKARAVLGQGTNR